MDSDFVKSIGVIPLALILAGVLLKKRTVTIAGLAWAVIAALLGTREVKASVNEGTGTIVYPSADKPQSIVEQTWNTAYWGSWGSLSSSPPK